MYKSNYLNVFINNNGNVVIVAGCPQDNDFQGLELNSIEIDANSLSELISALKMSLDAMEDEGDF